MQSYNHFTLEERESLRIYLSEGKSLRKAAALLNRSPSSVSREVKRNSNKQTGIYNAWGATSLYLKRRKRCRRRLRLDTDPELRAYAQACLRRYWSPETIVAMYKRGRSGARLSFSTLYAAIRRGMLPGISAKTHLRRRGGKKFKRGATNTIKPTRFIHERCALANERLRLGDWEGDTVHGSRSKGCLLTLIDRRSRYIVAALVPNYEANSVAQAFQTALRDLPVETITLDNGSEFARFKELEMTLGAQIYFADPHAPWQRGSNENVNGQLRFFFPKGCDFNSVSQESLDYVLELINTRPRKCLGWLSPKDVFSAKCCT